MLTCCRLVGPVPHCWRLAASTHRSQQAGGPEIHSTGRAEAPPPPPGDEESNDGFSIARLSASSGSCSGSSSGSGVEDVCDVKWRDWEQLFERTVTSTHTFVLFLETCGKGGGTVLLKSAAVAAKKKSPQDGATRVAAGIDPENIIASVSPVRGRLLVSSTWLPILV